MRLTKDGRRYLIIPFRHNAPGSLAGNAMPKPVMDWWKDGPKAPSSITGTYDRPSGTGVFDMETRKRVMVPGWRYNWGDRLHRDDLRGMQVSERDEKRLAGMVHFRRPGASGGAGHGQFITFRVMVEGSPGWKVPAQEGKWPAKQTAAAVQPVAEQAFRRAMEEDIARLVGGVAGGS